MTRLPDYRLNPPDVDAPAREDPATAWLRGPVRACCGRRWMDCACREDEADTDERDED